MKPALAITRFRSTPTTGAPLRVDAENGQIIGASAIQAVEALGHDLLVDLKTLSQVTERGNAAGGKGLKVRFTHPGMCSDGLGTLAGHAKSFRVVGDKSVCDIALADSAKISPQGDLPAYLLRLAAESPEDFGLSIVFTGTPAWVLADGTEMPVNHPSLRRATDEGSHFYGRPDNATTKKPFARVDDLRSVDFVDEPAANRDGLFADADLAHAFSDTSGALAEQAFAELDALLARLGQPLDVVEQFAQRYLAARRAPANPTTNPPENAMSLKLSAVVLLALVNEFADQAPLISKLAEAGEEEPAIRAKIHDARFAAVVTERDALKTKLAEADVAHKAALKAEQDAHAAAKTKLAGLEKLGSRTGNDPGGLAADTDLTGLTGDDLFKAEFKRSKEIQERFSLGGEPGYVAFRRNEANRPAAK